MSRKSIESAKPTASTTITKYIEFQELISKFVRGHFPLLAIVGRPGLSKSQTLKAAIGDRQCLIVKGRKSPIDFYEDVFVHLDEPIILDDADNLMSQRLCREYVKALTETDTYKRLDYGTKTPLLTAPKFFHTQSPVCIITNSWNSKDSVMEAIESRAEFVFFEPNWSEVYGQSAKWFWDQEIFDYVHERLSILKQPDCRIFVKAYNRKKAKMKNLHWQRLIDDHCDDEKGLVIRQLLDDDTYSSNTARAEEFCTTTGADRATFYRRLKDIRRYRPKLPVRRLTLRNTEPPHQDRPADAACAVDDDS